ncbi:hypothetical protein ACJ72_07610 [Emergomyces africanus]|uniref:Uncharacterized protein n=1 Tax=Emergomyces africanus TaxID=1955775 RepID=A0A1B7NMN6_9EURO|nr:hypothetical protein ACJ72_07610 [Emergomyces africanus]
MASRSTELAETVCIKDNTILLLPNRDGNTHIQQGERKVTYHPSHLLSEVGKSINTILPDLKVSTPYETTWIECLKTVSDCLSDAADQGITIDPPIPTQRKRALRDEALCQAQSSSQNSVLTKPIRLQYDTSQVPLPTRPTQQQKEHAKDKAIPFLPDE